ncbi:augmin complex subunit dgt3 [Anopheles moucheti]|uniref:augmin complex subunit dgt3 n=1 Tax=Anopheles moucheti TaxID=186751 RepID=UPI0022EFE9E1|nr:augmin complex subunit dgt3 [Anopheles moucheti]XP_052896013.1 augmin complex subunit dgt3 [Anopheles moucheti]
MEESSKVLETLKKIDAIDVRHIWIIHAETFREFFEWFTQLDDENLVTDLLLKSYQELVRNGTVLGDEILEEHLNALNQEYVSILDYTDCDVETLEQQLEQLVEVEEKYEKLFSGAKKTNIAVTKELSELERNDREQEYVLDKVASNSMDMARQLEENQQATQQQISDLHHCYYQRQNPPIFIYQMPIEQFDAKGDQFLKFVEMCVKKHFTVKRLDSSKSTDDVDNQQVIDELEGIKMRLDAEELKLLEAKREYAGVMKLVERLQNHSWVPMKVSALKKQCLELKNVNDHDLLRMDLLKHELDTFIRQVNELKIESVLYENNRAKLDRAVNRLEYIQPLCESISCELMNAELLWILMQLDLEKIRDWFDNADEMNGESKRCFKRIDTMKQIEKNSLPEEVYSDYLSPLSALVKQDTVGNTEESNRMKGCVQYFSGLLKRLSKLYESIAKGKYHRNADELLKQLTQQEMLMSRFVFDGPLKYPQFYGQKYLERLQKIGFALSQVERHLRNIRKEFVQNIEEPKQNQKFWLYYQRLWIWFLTEPKKVTFAIKEITAEASKTTSYKSISGIKCRSIVNDTKF